MFVNDRRIIWTTILLLLVVSLFGCGSERFASEKKEAKEQAKNNEIVYSNECKEAFIDEFGDDIDVVKIEGVIGVYSDVLFSIPSGAKTESILSVVFKKDGKKYHGYYDIESKTITSDYNNSQIEEDVIAEFEDYIEVTHVEIEDSAYNRAMLGKNETSIDTIGENRGLLITAYTADNIESIPTKQLEKFKKRCDGMLQFTIVQTEKRASFPILHSLSLGYDQVPMSGDGENLFKQNGIVKTIYIYDDRVNILDVDRGRIYNSEIP